MEGGPERRSWMVRVGVLLLGVTRLKEIEDLWNFGTGGCEFMYGRLDP